jgi:hypothetical protein
MTDHLPAIREQFKDANPLHKMLVDTLEHLGGIDFLANWAETNPGEYINILMRLAPPPQAAGDGKGANVLNLNVHPSLAPGPLDVVADQ